MKYKVGDKVRIVKERVSHMNSEGKMDKYLGTIMTINFVYNDGNYRMLEDNGRWFWDDASIEGYANIIKKSDLKYGDVVTYRCGHVRIVKGGDLVYLKDFAELSFHLDRFDNDLFYNGISKDPQCDIIKVYRPETEETFYTERAKKVKEMTVAEIEKELGYSIKVIKEEK